MAGALEGEPIPPGTPTWRADEQELVATVECTVAAQLLEVPPFPNGEAELPMRTRCRNPNCLAASD
jgi:hypothetical protein